MLHLTTHFNKYLFNVEGQINQQECNKLNTGPKQHKEQTNIIGNSSQVRSTVIDFYFIDLTTDI